MAITQATCNSYKTELLTGTHVFGTNTFKIALYTSAATLDKNTTVYSSTSEVSGAGYTAGGATLTVTAPVLDGDSAIVDFADVTWATAVTARGALIYNASSGNKAVCVLDFGADKTSTVQFRVNFPAPLAATCIVKVS